MERARAVVSRLREATVICGLLAVCAAVASGQQLAGKGEWRSLSGDTIGGTWTASLTRTGNRVQGTLILGGSNVLSGGDVVGGIDTCSIMLGVVAAGARQAAFSGKLDGDSIKGEWSGNVLSTPAPWLIFRTASIAFVPLPCFKVNTKPSKI